MSTLTKDLSFLATPGRWSDVAVEPWRAVTRPLRLDAAWRFAVAGGWEADRQPYEPGVQRVNQFAANLILRGRVRYRAEGGAWQELGPGTLYQKLPGRGFETEVDLASGYAEVFVVLDADTAAPLLAWRLLDPEPVHHLPPDPLILEEYGTLQRQMEAPEAERPSPQVLLDLVGFLQAQYARAKNAAGGVWERAVREACAWLESHAGERCRLDDLARRLGVPYRTFRREFRARTGVSPGRYRIQARLERARALLATRPVKDVARELGYPDPFTFSAQVRRRLGRPPSAFRA